MSGPVEDAMLHSSHLAALCRRVTQIVRCMVFAAPSNRSLEAAMASGTIQLVRLGSPSIRWSRSGSSPVLPRMRSRAGQRRR
jgi:hypothetical protein